MVLQLRRGLQADRTSITPSVGEPLYTTDDHKLYIGDVCILKCRYINNSIIK